MAERAYESVKIRDVDYEVAKRQVEAFPITIVDCITAWRILWESASETNRMKAIGQVRSQSDSSKSAAATTAGKEGLKLPAPTKSKPRRGNRTAA